MGEGGGERGKGEERGREDERPDKVGVRLFKEEEKASGNTTAGIQTPGS